MQDNREIKIAEKIVAGTSRMMHYVFEPRMVSSRMMTTPSEWKSAYGRPSAQNIKRYVEKFNESLEHGGANEHLGAASTIYGGRIIDQIGGGDVVAEWEDWGIVRDYANRPKFEVIGSRVSSRVRNAIEVGQILENEAIRVQRWRTSIAIWDMTNAGKRGKRVDKISLYNLDWSDRGGGGEEIEDFANKIMSARSYDQAVKMVMEALQKINSVSQYKVEVDQRQERGVDVSPAGFGPVEVNGKHVYVKADYDSFTIRDKEDMYNEPTCIPAIRGGKADIKVFYRWAQDNQAMIENARFNEVTDAMTRAGIRYHYFCAVD